MEVLPEPPDVETLVRLGPLVRTLPAGTRLDRIFRAGGDHPGRWNEFRHFGPLSGRFDHHLADPDTGASRDQARGILYAATGPRRTATCLAEVFQVGATIDRFSNAPVLTSFALARAVQLLDLTGLYATRIGASTAIHSGSRFVAQAWSRRFHAAFESVDGLLYCSSMYANAPAIALYERAIDAMPEAPHVHRPLGDPRLANSLRLAAAPIGYLVI